MERKMSMRERKRRRGLQILVRLPFLALASHGWMGNYINGNHTEWINTEIISAPKDMMWGSLTEACWSATEEMTRCCGYFMATKYYIIWRALHTYNYTRTIFPCKSLKFWCINCELQDPSSGIQLIYIFFKGVIKNFQLFWSNKAFDNWECIGIDH